MQNFFDIAAFLAQITDDWLGAVQAGLKACGSRSDNLKDWAEKELTPFTFTTVAAQCGLPRWRQSCCRRPSLRCDRSRRSFMRSIVRRSTPHTDTHTSIHPGARTHSNTPLVICACTHKQNYAHTFDLNDFEFDDFLQKVSLVAVHQARDQRVCKGN